MEIDAEKYTDSLVKVLDNTQANCIKYDHAQINSEHFMEALIDDNSNVVVTILKSLGINLSNIKKELSMTIKKKPETKNEIISIGAASCFVELIRNMEKIAEARGDKFITVEIAFIALFEDRKCSSILDNHGVKPTEVETEIARIRNGSKPETKNAEDSRDFIRKYTTNLTDDGREGRIDPIIGRDEEIRRAIQVLLRKTKNNPVFIGESGVGKTAIAEGLALRIVNNEVPEGLEGKDLLSLDMGQLIAGAKFQGEFEERLKGLIKELNQTNGQSILFIDEMHLLVGAGKNGGSMDAANLLKPELARGNMHVVGATTLDEYREYIEKDPALERRFQKVLVEEPSIEDTISILRGIKEKYEVHHGIDITDDALIAAAKLSSRYITDRNLPDKAIDLMDEAASVVRMEVESKPESMDMLSRKILQKEIELKSVEKEENQVARIEKLKERILGMKKEYSTLEEKWLAEKASLSGESDLRAEIDALKFQEEKSEREGDLEKTAEIRHELMPNLQKRLEIMKENTNLEEVEHELLRTKVSENEIKEVISRWTGIPVNKMGKGESEKLMELEDSISKRVIGQKEAIKNVSSSIRRSRAGLSDPNRPIGSFLFLGPTGVGKTEMCKAVSKVLFENEDDFIRIDMSEYMEKHSVARLIGAPPGYVGYEEGGELTEAVRRKPYSVVLFDEIEKAHPDVFNILLQVLDDGRLTDSQGRLVNFKNTLIIMTSNIGSQIIQESVKNGEEYETIQTKAFAELENYLRPEFINRIDDVVVFHPLTKADVSKIATLQINSLNKRLLDKELELKLNKSAMTKLIEKGFDPKFGARPLKRAIQRHIENPLADQIIQGFFVKGDIIKATVKDKVIIFKK
jgi:ATP-dependent Clp protease ATP-binding subunit ClpB